MLLEWFLNSQKKKKKQTLELLREERCALKCAKPIRRSCRMLCVVNTWTCSWGIRLRASRGEKKKTRRRRAESMQHKSTPRKEKVTLRCLSGFRQLGRTTRFRVVLVLREEEEEEVDPLGVLDKKRRQVCFRLFCLRALRLKCARCCASHYTSSEWLWSARTRLCGSSAHAHTL